MKVGEVSEVLLHPLKNPSYIKPHLVTYRQDGVEKSWEVVKAHDSVAILLYLPKEEQLLLVKQFRPALYLNETDGITYELCAGLIDKEKPLEVIAQEEIEEECGYRVPLENIERITSFYTSVGFAGARQHLYFATIDADMRISQGGGVESESIELYYLPIDSMKAFLFDEEKPKTPGLMFAFYWLLEKNRESIKAC